jgi:hypothetical protein
MASEWAYDFEVPVLAPGQVQIESAYDFSVVVGNVTLELTSEYVFQVTVLPPPANVIESTYDFAVPVLSGDTVESTYDFEVIISNEFPSAAPVRVSIMRRR